MKVQKRDSVAGFEGVFDCRSGVASSIPARYHTFMEIYNEIIFMVILLLPLIQEGLLSVTSDSMCTKYWLNASQV